MHKLPVATTAATMKAGMIPLRELKVREDGCIWVKEQSEDETSSCLVIDHETS